MLGQLRNVPLGSGRLVLVVEDEFILAMELEQFLGQHGWKVLGPAATVGEALRLLDGATPHLAILDVNLRGEMVMPVAERLREQGVPFVLASAYDDVARIPGAASLVSEPNAGKPINTRKLLAALANALPEH